MCPSKFRLELYFRMAIMSFFKFDFNYAQILHQYCQGLTITIKLPTRSFIFTNAQDPKKKRLKTSSQKDLMSPEFQDIHIKNEADKTHDCHAEKSEVVKEIRQPDRRTSCNHKYILEIFKLKNTSIHYTELFVQSNQVTRDEMKTMHIVTSGIQTIYPSEAHEFIPGFSRVHVAHSYVFSVVLCKSLCIIFPFFL